MTSWQVSAFHDDVINWKHFLRYWSFVWGIHRSTANSPLKGQCCGALMFSVTCAWTINWSNNGDAGDLRRHHAHYNVISMPYHCPFVRRTSGQPGLDECPDHRWPGTRRTPRKRSDPYIFMSLIVLYLLHSTTSVFSFYIDVVMTLSIIISYNLT